MIKPFFVDSFPNLPPQQTTVPLIHFEIEQQNIPNATTRNHFVDLISPSLSSISVSPTVPISTITNPITSLRKPKINNKAKNNNGNNPVKTEITVDSNDDLNKSVPFDTTSIINDDVKLDFQQTICHPNQPPKTFDDLQQSDLHIFANYSLTSSPIIPHKDNSLQYGIDLFSTKLIEDSTNQLLDNIDYQWSNVTKLINNDPTTTERQNII